MVDQIVDAVTGLLAHAGVFGLIWNLKSDKGTAYAAAAWGTLALGCWFQVIKDLVVGL